MSTGLQGEVEDIETEEATALPWTRFLGKIGIALWWLRGGWRAPRADD